MASTAYPQAVSSGADLEAHSDHDEKAPSSTAGSIHSPDYNTRDVHKTNGVAQMEAISAAAHAGDDSGRWMLYGIALSMFIMYWAYCQAGSTSYSFAALASSSFASHSTGISATNIATGIISSVCTPCASRSPFLSSTVRSAS